MKGRQENTEKIEKYIQTRLESAPQIVKDYSYSFTDATPSTKKAYIFYTLDFVDFFKDSDIYSLRTSDINRYMEHIRYRYVNGEKIENKESIRATKLFAIKRFYNFLIDDGYITYNPCNRVKVPRSNIENRVIAMDKEEIRVLKDTVLEGVGSERAVARQEDWRRRDLAIVTLGIATGLRVTAISEINISDINFDDNTIIVTEKENYTREIKIGDNTKQAIINWIKDRDELMKGYKDCDALFISNRRVRISGRSIERLINKYAVNINKHITPHKMRSSCATNLYEMTGDIYRVQQQLGHKSIEVTKRYTAMSDDKRNESAMLLDTL